ncbi:MAG: hypothetical protein LBJ33_04995 [Pseudomonas putida]|jgi:hypothetical protein|nr:hypothetical protein [Pseudomonas putida]
MLSKLIAAGLCLWTLQSAAADDKTRVLIDRRWYTEDYVRTRLFETHPSLARNAFHKSIKYAYAPAVATLAGGRFFEHPMRSRKSDHIWMVGKNAGKNVGKETEDLCLMEIGKALASLKWQASREARSVGPAEGLIVGIRAGELAKAPWNLANAASNPISVISPPGNAPLLCNVYKSMRRSDGVTYDVSVALTAEGFYYKGR